MDRISDMIKPIVAAILSLVFAGLGHFFLKHYARGALFVIPALFAWKLSDYSPRMILFNIILFIVSAFDAFSLGKRGIGLV